jgi:hypothetical protein
LAAGLGNNYGIKRADVTDAMVHQWWEADIDLYYRPIQALKFGLGYVYTRADYYNATTVQSNRTNIGEAHSVRFAGWFFF